MSKALVCICLIVCRPLVSTFSKFFSSVSTSPAVTRFFFENMFTVLSWRFVAWLSNRHEGTPALGRVNVSLLEQNIDQKECSYQLQRACATMNIFFRGDSQFVYFDPPVWNSLLLHIRNVTIINTFKSAQKPYLSTFYNLTSFIFVTLDSSLSLSFSLSLCPRAHVHARMRVCLCMCRVVPIVPMHTCSLNARFIVPFSVKLR